MSTSVRSAGPDEPGGILVASDGREGSDGALSAARLLAGRTNASVSVLSARQPPVSPVTRYEVVAAPRPGWPPEELQRLEAQLERTGLSDTGWPLTLLWGDPARQIADHARRTGAQLVVVGRAARRLTGEYGAELALRLLQLTDVPVLSAMPEWDRLPHRIVVAMDFTPYSVYAAEVALSLAAPDATVYLVHVRPPVPAIPRTEEVAQWEREYDAGLAGEFARVRSQLDDPAGARVFEPVSLVGDPADAIGDYAAGMYADLVVTAAHGRGFVDRLLLGSVATGLLRRAPCSVLCVPGSAQARAGQRRWAMEGMRTHSIPTTEWRAVLADLTRRASGHPCTIEIDSPALGAQHLASGVPFAGASVDPHRAEVVLTLGTPGPEGHALTHRVTEVEGIDTMTDGRGMVHVLRISSGGAQTLVSFGA